MQHESSSDVKSNDQSQKDDTIELQFIPIKASPEIMNAIRRFRNTTGVFYDYSFSLTKNVKPHIRAVQNGCYCFSSEHHASTSFPSFDSRNDKVPLNGNINHKISFSCSRHDTLSSNYNRHQQGSYKSTHHYHLNNKLRSDLFDKLGNNSDQTSHVVTRLSTDLFGYGECGSQSNTYSRQDKMSTVSSNLELNEKDFQILDQVNNTHCTFIAPRYPCMKYENPDTSKICKTSKIVTFCSKNEKFQTLLRVNESSSSRIEPSRAKAEAHFVTKDYHKNIPMISDVIKTNDIHNTYPKKVLIKPGKSDLRKESQFSTPFKTTYVNTGVASSLILAPPNGTSCAQLADCILAAVDEDLNKVYQICHSKIRYSELIERSHPDKFLKI